MVAIASASFASSSVVSTFGGGGLETAALAAGKVDCNQPPPIPHRRFEADRRFLAAASSNWPPFSVTGPCNRRTTAGRPAQDPTCQRSDADGSVNPQRTAHCGTDRALGRSNARLGLPLCRSAHLERHLARVCQKSAGAAPCELLPGERAIGGVLQTAIYCLIFSAMNRIHGHAIAQCPAGI